MPQKKWTATKSARHFAERAAERLIKQIVVGRAPWQKGWDKPAAADLQPFNPQAHHQFKDLNAIVLRSVSEVRGYSDPRWLNIYSANQLGARVRKGERGTKIEFLRHVHYGKSNKEGRWPEVTHHTYTVFNAKQIENMPPLEQHLPREPQQWEACERAERLLQNSGAHFERSNAAWSCYAMNRDRIVMPDQEQFRSPEAYYGAAMYEMSRWTGHESRLNRNTLIEQSTGIEGQAKEELRVHLTCLTVSGELRLPKEPAGPRYKQSWIEAISNNPNELRSAARDSDRMAHFLLQYDRQPERGQNVEQIPRVARGVDDLPERKHPDHSLNVDQIPREARGLDMSR